MSTTPTTLSKLRHLYENMVNGGVRDTASAKRIAEGLLSPAIAELERAALTQGAGEAVEPVYWEYRWKDTHPQTVTSGQWYPWEKVEPRNGRLETVESRLAELRDYIAQGKCYELRTLYAAPPAQQLQQAVARAIEECAVICERAVDSIWAYHEENHKRTGRNVCTNLAAAIRAKGTHQ